MTKRMIGRKNRNGLTVDDLRSMVADAEKIGAYVRLKAKTKMNGTLIELTIDEPEVEPPADPWTPPFDVNPRFSPPTERPSD